MLFHRLLPACLALAVPLLAQAQWQWVDKDGRRVYSDSAPPPDIPAKSILRQPGMRAPAPAAEQASAASAPVAAVPPRAAASAPRVSGKDRDLEERRKRIQSAEIDKKKAAEQEVAESAAENCRRARESKNRYLSGIRMARVNEKGEREVMDEQQRTAEVQRLDTVIARDCASVQ